MLPQRKTLSDLPNELLHIVAGYMGERQRRPKWGKILSSLSTVDRRLRDFCIASMRDQELSFSSYDIYTRKLQAINMDVSAGYMSRIGYVCYTIVHVAIILQEY